MYTILTDEEGKRDLLHEISNNLVSAKGGGVQSRGGYVSK